ncbi:MAG TPA: VPLPA-CTERM-specific exosortase XrtD [Methylibium sp.]|nr:VPLPA-CTERM-specific exosortase XrtD [Methylibium sp.]
MSSPALLPSPSPVWRLPPAQWALLALAVAAAVAVFLPGLRFMVANWEQVEEYSYGYFIPVIAALLIWQKSAALRQHELRGSWGGLPLLALALALGVVGEFSAIRLFGQYGFVVALFGLSVCLLGWRGTRIIAVPLAILCFMIPLPQFVLRELSQQLQLLSSQLGVALIRQFGISVFLEGNVIDLGSYKLQVVEACSGLRYLFPLMVLGFLAAYCFQGAWWKRALIFASTVPLTILINSLRIGLIGVTVEHWGSAMAEGLLHDFEGWFMFMLCIVLLLAEMSLLARLGGRGVKLHSVFGFDLPDPVARDAAVAYRRVRAPLPAAGLLLCAAAAASLWAPEPVMQRPERGALADFPMAIDGGWQGRRDRLAPDVLATLALSDHLIANYARDGDPWVNLYVAYYASQSSGESTHSPRTCIPGGGWSIVAIDELSLDGAPAAAAPLPVNRVLIQRGEERQLVYYWFQQRGRRLTDELSVKWFILHDSIASKRSDGALIRLVTPVSRDEDMLAAERRIGAFAAALQPLLSDYVPE